MDATTLYGVVGLSSLGTVLGGMGLFMAVRGLQARAEITAALAEEDATTPRGGGGPAPVEGAAADAAPSAPDFGPVVPINNAKAARARVAEIKWRTLGTIGPYQALAQDDPQRQWFLNGLVIRNALNMAVMGYGVANIAIAAGAALAFLGLGVVALGVPLVLAFGE